jgi:hypothetical protein
MFAPEELFQPTQSNICKSTLKMSGSVYLMVHKGKHKKMLEFIKKISGVVKTT